MIKRYDNAFAKLSESNRKAFIPFTLLGWPNAEQSFAIIQAMIDGGATALELGFAFSDPVADGPIIQAAAFETIDSGFKLTDAFQLLKRVRAYDANIPIGLLIYYNTVLSQGLGNFYKSAGEAGVDSILIADLPAECAEETADAANSADIAPVFIISPLTDDVRLSAIAQVGRGYLYVVSRLGITGTHEGYDDALQSLLARARKLSALPLCVGFGVSNPEQAGKMIEIGADGVITGSRVIQLMRETKDAGQLRDYVKSMVHAVNLTPTHR